MGQDIPNTLENGNREAVIEWLQMHSKKKVLLTRKGSLVKVIGHPEDVDELDACSMELMECRIVPYVPDLEITVSFHPETLSLHMIARGDSQGHIALSFPVSMPYEEVALTSWEAEKERLAHLERQLKQIEPEYSPYELLFQDFD